MPTSTRSSEQVGTPPRKPATGPTAARPGFRARRTVVALRDGPARGHSLAVVEGSTPCRVGCWRGRHQPADREVTVSELADDVRKDLDSVIFLRRAQRLDRSRRQGPSPAFSQRPHQQRPAHARSGRRLRDVISIRIRPWEPRDCATSQQPQPLPNPVHHRNPMNPVDPDRGKRPGTSGPRTACWRKATG